MFGDDFFPTPDHLIQKLISDIDVTTINSLLEPSCGKANIVEYIINKANNVRSYKKIKLDIDCIEIDENLRYLLKGKGLRVVHDDFLTYDTLKAYSHIIANFPFSEGDKHLRKALSMLEVSGGKLRCLVNAETIKNPYSNTRKEILNILNKNNATIEFLQNEFVDAERSTNVEVALIRCDMVKKPIGSILLDTLKQAKEEKENTYENKSVTSNNFITAIVEQYNFECSIGLKLIEEFKQLESFTKSSFEDNRNENILSLRLRDDRGYSDPSENVLKNDYLKKVRYKYWKALFNNTEFTKLFTSNLQRDFYNRLDELSDYDFTEFNIFEIRKQLNQQVVTGVTQTILNLFEEFSHRHYWDKDTSSNIHYFNGWKTNSSWKISKRVIIPLNGFGAWNNEFDPLHYQCIDKLLDVEKVFNYLDTGNTEELNLREVLQQAKDNHQTKDIISKFFKITFYKKQTVHLTFLDDDLLKKFNIFGALQKGWLPPSYSKRSYQDMTVEEKEVIDNFEGEKEYSKTLTDVGYYIYNPSQILMLA